MNDKAKAQIEKELKEKTGVLDLSHCELDRIPAVVGEMVWLTALSFESNQISKIEGLDGLASLTTLYLHSNQISKIEGVNGLASLTSLSLHSNQISKIEGLDGLASLTSLYLESNQISKIEGLLSLSNLEFLDFEQNPIAELPPEYQAFLSALSFFFFFLTKIKELGFFYLSVIKGLLLLC
ncbi:MAG: leucine-rich repeat domain-containing protein [Saprospiraceae bacterium]